MFLNCKYGKWDNILFLCETGKVSADLGTDNRFELALDDTGQVGVWGFWGEVRQKKGFSPGALKGGIFP